MSRHSFGLQGLHFPEFHTVKRRPNVSNFREKHDSALISVGAYQSFNRLISNRVYNNWLEHAKSSRVMHFKQNGIVKVNRNWMKFFSYSSIFQPLLLVKETYNFYRGSIVNKSLIKQTKSHPNTPPKYVTRRLLIVSPTSLRLFH